MAILRTLLRLVLPIELCALAGCSGIGPRTIAPSRFDYTAAIGDSWKQQLLINLVKLRYGDSLVFLDVSSVISQYQVAGQVNWGGTFNNYSSGPNPVIDVAGSTASGLSSGLNWGGSWNNPYIRNTQSVGATGSYADRPTITYVPLSGEKFTRTLMRPIPPPALMSLIQSGYPIDLVLRLCVHSVNGVRNRYGGPARSRNADPEFYPLLERLRRIQNTGAVDLRVEKTKETEAIMMTLRAKVDEQTDEDTAFIRKTLRLDASAQDFKLVFGSVSRNDKEIAMLSRSVLEILIDSASCIDVPAAHVQEKRVNSSLPEDTYKDAPVESLIRIHSSRWWPADAFIAVPYRSHWYWIDDRDLRSKSVFSFLSFIFSLTDTEAKEGAPIVTIPAG